MVGVFEGCGELLLAGGAEVLQGGVGFGGGFEGVEEGVVVGVGGGGRHGWVWGWCSRGVCRYLALFATLHAARVSSALSLEALVRKCKPRYSYWPTAVKFSQFF